MRTLIDALSSRRRQACCLNNVLRLSLVLALLYSPDLAFAGGVKIDEKTIAFDNDPTKRKFAPGTEVVMTFAYEAWTYGGKPYECIVFELNQLLSEDTVPRSYLFVREISKKRGHGSARFSLPDPNSTYRISYHEAVYFSHKPLNAFLHGGLVTSEKDKAAIANFYKTNYSGTKSIAEIKSLSAGLATRGVDMMTIYFKPGLKQEVDKRVAEKLPPTFEWRKGADSAPGIQNEEYSYRLDPIEDWSHYSSATKATYYLLTPGNYEFEVRARYIINGRRRDTAIASLPIQIKSVISAPPPLEDVAKGDRASQQFWDTDPYPHRMALLIAISEYDDPRFGALPYVEKDVRLFRRTLQQHGFTTEELKGVTTADKVRGAMNGFRDRVTPGDAVIIYFSGHGTFRELSNFLVSTDCNSQMPNADTCISYEWLKQWIDEVMVKGARHLLVVLDACQAGLGLYSKSESRTPLEALARYPGAHMMTAGLMEQEAHVDLQEGDSVFTQYLVKGLAGAANWNKDKVITLSELLVYVQNSVSRHVSDKFSESQVPVMGKVKGAGEMLFRTP